MGRQIITEPIQVGKLVFKNRMVMAPMETRLSTPIGDVSQEMCHRRCVITMQSAQREERQQLL